MNECIDCRSTRIIKGASAVDRANYPGGVPTDFGFEIKIAEHPDALIFKQNVGSGTRADVCADCGFVAIYAANPGALWTAYQNRLNNG